jgi:hypothetical protein
LALLAVAVGLVIALPISRAEPPPLRLQEDFTTDPFARGWQRAGQGSLFRWDAKGGHLAVTWDSGEPNHYCYLPLGTFLTRDDDFRLEFTLTLDDITIGTTAGKPYTFQIALGLLNLAQATGAGFRRGTGMDSPNLVEWDYFPDSGFGATVAAAMVSETNAWATSFNPSYELQPGGTYGFVMDYRVATRQMTVEMLVGEQRTALEPARIREPFGDFAVDALAISSYSDAGQDPSFAGSVLAHGRIEQVTLEMPPPPIRRFRGGLVEGAWRGEFTGWLGWRYALERSGDLRVWSPVGGTFEGTGRRQALMDAQPTPDHSFYRLRAEPR